jgi:hypothetical protein
MGIVLVDLLAYLTGTDATSTVRPALSAERGRGPGAGSRARAIVVVTGHWFATRRQGPRRLDSW